MTVSASGTTLKTYHIGNSLTNDAEVRDELPNIAALAGNQLDAAWHLLCGNPLRRIVATPEDHCVPQPLGTWEEALAGSSFDAITLQPHTGSTLGQEVEAAQQLIDAAHVNSPNIDVYIYQAYPAREEAENYQAAWDVAGDPNSSSQLTFQRDHFDWLYDEVAGPETALIPVGEVIYNFDRLASEGEIDGFSGAEELYRDARHLNNVGRLLAALTFHTVLFNQSPLGLDVTSFDDNFAEDSPDRDLTPELQATLQQLVLETVSADVRTSVVPEPGAAFLFAGLVPFVIRRRNKSCGGAI